MKLTFKEYLESKEQLRKAIANTPVSVMEYEVKKYCSLPVGEAEEDKTLVVLKPKQKIIVEWKYDDIDNPSIESIRFEGVITIDEDVEHLTFWNSTKLKKWLARYANAGSNSQ